VVVLISCSTSSFLVGEGNSRDSPGLLLAKYASATFQISAAGLVFHLLTHVARDEYEIGLDRSTGIANVAR